jgi:hypothetical protein
MCASLTRYLMLRRTSLSILVFMLLVMSLRQSATLAQTAQTKTIPFAAGQIVVPTGYKTERINGPDFSVDYVLPVDAQLDKTDVMLGIYTGGFPSYQPPKKGVRTKSGKFGDRTLKWHIWKTSVESKTVYRYETLVPLESGQSGNPKKKSKDMQPPIKSDVWHIFIAAPDPRHLRELMEIFKSYRVR